MTAIEFEHVSKQYRLGLVSTRTLSHDLRRFWITNILGKEDPYLKIGETNDRATRGTSDYVWALRDINFKVEQGDVVGIIGKNGAGKSTLLKLLSRVTGPTTGTIRAHGRIGSLLEVGTGFHGEMTGRENIFMNGAILGMTRQEIQSKLDEIIDFSGCERYIDTPVKRYSSGMTVRLGFAVAAFLEPEILVVDEVLAVGDAEFQKKAIGKMKDVSHSHGRTVLFVSHNMTSVKNLCKTGIILDKGELSYAGQISDVIDRYLDNQTQRSAMQLYDIHDRYGTGVMRFTNIEFSSKNETRTSFEVGEAVTIKIYFDVAQNNNIEIRNSRIDIGINTMMDQRVLWLSTYMFEDNIDFSHGYISFDIPQLLLNTGTYNVNLYCEINGEVADWVQNCAKIQMNFHDFYGNGRNLPQDASVAGNTILSYSVHY